jgi:hypothetical protein
MLQQFDLKLQRLVAFGKLSCSFRNPPIELVGDAFLFAEEARLLQSDSDLVGHHTQKQALGLRWEVSSLGSGKYESKFALDSQMRSDE